MTMCGVAAGTNDRGDIGNARPLGSGLTQQNNQRSVEIE
jgi:hypothetical protein